MQQKSPADEACATASLDVEDAIVGRQSVRAFLRDKPVSRELIERILSIAGRSPSGSNVQPWKVWVVQGAMRDTVSKALQAEHDTGAASTREFDYYPKDWPDPVYYGRRRACGIGLYSTLGIGKEDKAGMHAQHGRNFQFFDAPVSVIVTVHRGLALGSWMDCGMFIQTFMLAARTQGLETCPQAALAHYQHTLRTCLSIPAGQIILSGIALGYADPDATVNTYRTPRIALDDFVTWTN